MSKFVPLAALLLLTLPGLAAAQSPQRQNDGGGGNAARGLMRYDANHDGVVDHAEWVAGQEARFRQLDGNGDGKLSQDEMFGHTGAPPTDRQVRSQANYFRLLDTDKDGFVSKEEFMAQAERNFARCDLDKDGRITTAECRQALRRKPPTAAQPASTER